MWATPHYVVSNTIHLLVLGFKLIIRVIDCPTSELWHPSEIGIKNLCIFVNEFLHIYIYIDDPSLPHHPSKRKWIEKLPQFGNVNFATIGSFQNFLKQTQLSLKIFVMKLLSTCKWPIIKLVMIAGWTWVALPWHSWGWYESSNFIGWNKSY